MVCWCVLFNVPLDNLSLIWRLGSVNEKLNFYFTAGEILATADLSQHTVPGYDLFVYVYDGNTLVGPRTLTVIISGKTSLITKKYKNYVVTRLVSHIIKIMVVFCINSGFLCLVVFFNYKKQLNKRKRNATISALLYPFSDLNRPLTTCSN